MAGGGFTGRANLIEPLLGLKFVVDYATCVLCRKLNRTTFGIEIVWYLLAMSLEL